MSSRKVTSMPAAPASEPQIEWYPSMSQRVTIEVGPDRAVIEFNIGRLVERELRRRGTKATVIPLTPPKGRESASVTVRLGRFLRELRRWTRKSRATPHDPRTPQKE
jgi:hypothetical protein